jgi:hypothetical protein
MDKQKSSHLSCWWQTTLHGFGNNDNKKRVATKQWVCISSNDGLYLFTGLSSFSLCFFCCYLDMRFTTLVRSSPQIFFISDINDFYSKFLPTLISSRFNPILSSLTHSTSKPTLLPLVLWLSFITPFSLSFSWIKLWFYCSDQEIL